MPLVPEQSSGWNNLPMYRTYRTHTTHTTHTTYSENAQNAYNAQTKVHDTSLHKWAVPLEMCVGLDSRWQGAAWFSACAMRLITLWLWLYTLEDGHAINHDRHGVAWKLVIVVWYHYGDFSDKRIEFWPSLSSVMSQCRGAHGDVRWALGKSHVSLLRMRCQNKYLVIVTVTVTVTVMYLLRGPIITVVRKVFRPDRTLWVTKLVIPATNLMLLYSNFEWSLDVQVSKLEHEPWHWTWGTSGPCAGWERVGIGRSFSFRMRC